MRTILSAAAAIALFSAAPAWAQTQGDTATPFGPDFVSPAEAPEVGNPSFDDMPEWAQRALIPQDNTRDGGESPDTN